MEGNLDDFLQGADVPSLNVEQQQFCEGMLTEEELKKSMLKMKLNRSPGGDGIPAEVYRQFWPLFKQFFY